MVLRPGFEETEENLIGLMESRLQDHERIRGGLYFIESIPRYMKVFYAPNQNRCQTFRHGKLFCDRAIRQSKTHSFTRDENWKVYKDALKEYNPTLAYEVHHTFMIIVVPLFWQQL